MKPTYRMLNVPDGEEAPPGAHEAYDEIISCPPSRAIQLAHRAAIEHSDRKVVLCQSSTKDLVQALVEERRADLRFRGIELEIEVPSSYQSLALCTEPSYNVTLSEAQCASLREKLTQVVALGESLDGVKKDVFYRQVTGTGPTYELDRRQTRLLHAGLGILTEAAELAEQVLQLIDIVDNPRDLDAIDWVNVKEELGDLLWYIAIGVEGAQGSLDDIMDQNIKKLRTRFPDRFEAHRALHRDLDAERAVLEQE